MFSEHRLFFQQFRQRYHETGAIAPSGRALADALTRNLDGSEAPPRRILEVGPGTGGITQRLVTKLRAGDRLTLVELNDRFVAHLHERFAKEPDFVAVAEQCKILHHPVQELPGEQHFDVIVSGLPLNNFSIELVDRILTTLERLLAPGGTISFFEYLAIRKARAIVSPAQDRARLRGISETLEGVFARHRTWRERVWLNLPPAVVHHLHATSKTNPVRAESSGAAST